LASGNHHAGREQQVNSARSTDVRNEQQRTGQAVGWQLGKKESGPDWCLARCNIEEGSKRVESSGYWQADGWNYSPAGSTADLLRRRRKAAMPIIPNTPPPARN